MTLKIGDTCELRVIDLCSNASGYDYLFTEDSDGRTHNIYNILKYQYTDIPETINAIVSSIDIYGRLKFKQDECKLLQDHYKLGHLYSFKISDCKIDKNDKQYYVLEDDFSYQRWYSNEDLLIGDYIILEAKSITNNGYIFYSNYQHIDAPQTDSTTVVVTSSTVTDRPTLNVGDESDTLEFKTSIVFLPGSSEANIDKQLFNIIREITSFMNAKGGTLYIGIHDKTHEIIGIANDLPHLKEGESRYASSYSPDYDHYELKIRDTLVYLCSTYAGSLININFPEQDSIKYCKIDIEAANRPVWMKGNMLFQRQGNQTQMLLGEDLTQFVGERIGSYIVSQTNKTTGESMSQEEISTLIHNAVKSAINERRKQVAAPVINTPVSSIKYWVIWYNDGSWMRQKEKSSDSNIFKQLPVTEDTNEIVVAFCYKSGTLNTVKMSSFKKGTKNGYKNKDGMSNKEVPLDIFICHPSNLIAIHSADIGGTEYVKLHHISDVNPTGSGKNQGPFVIPKNQGHILECKLITPIQADNMKSIIALKKETSQSFGFPIEGINIKNEVAYFNNL